MNEITLKSQRASKPLVKYTTYLPYIFTLLAEKHTQPNLSNTQQMLELIRYDLSQLLNTRCQPESLADKNELLLKSVYNYGMPDLSIYDPASHADREKVRKVIQQAIKRFEPRLTNVAVLTHSSHNESHKLQMHFKIEADVLLYQPHLYIAFDSIFDAKTEKITVQRVSEAEHD